MVKATSIRELADKLEKAFQKTLAKMPDIKVVEFGLYKVRGSTGNWYEVRVGVTVEGEYFAACPCRGNLYENGCYHGARAFAKHQIIRSELIIKKRHHPEHKIDWANVPYLKVSESKPVERVGGVRI